MADSEDGIGFRRHVERLATGGNDVTKGLLRRYLLHGEQRS
jgi:hypothetical protein